MADPSRRRFRPAARLVGSVVGGLIAALPIAPAAQLKAGEGVASDQSASPELTALKVENARLNEILAEVKDGLTNLEARAAALRTELTRVGAALSRERESRQAAEDEVAALREELAQASARLAAADDRRQALAVLEDRLANAERRTMELADANDALAIRHRECQARHAAANASGTPASTVATLNGRLEALQAERDRLRRQSADMTAVAERCLARVEGYDAKFAAALREIERLEDALAERR